VTVYAAYFDDSRGERIHAIAGYFAPLDFWEDRFAPEWKGIIESAPHKISEFKASDCRQMVNEFDPTNGWTREECDALTKRCVDLLTRPDFASELYGLGAVVRVGKMESDEERDLAEREALKFCLLSVTHFVLWLTRPDSTVHCTCDRQKGWQGMLSNIFGFVRDGLEIHKHMGSISDLDFEDSKVLAPLQAADLLAYETRKELLNRLELPPRKRSAALARLVNSGRHLGLYMDPEIVAGILDEDGPKDRARFLYFDPRMEADLPSLLKQIPQRSSYP
jgi:hypothetical protein